MLEEGRLSESELVTMLLFTVLGTAFFFLPSEAAAFAGRDVWPTPILATLPGLLTTIRLSLPVFSLARKIDLAHFFQHLESLVLISWVASVFVKAVLGYYVMVLGMGQWLNLKSYRPLVLRSGLLLLAQAGYNWPNVAAPGHFIARVVPFYSGGISEFAVPVLPAAGALVRGRIRNFRTG